MIITRTPLRISLGGGGTDLPHYYRESGYGYLIAAAITKYTYVAVNDNFDPDILLKYSKVERAKSVDSIEHPILRECLNLVDIQGGIEVSSMADIPTGTGLGSSGAFTVGVLKALHMHKHKVPSNQELASLACEIEINRLKEPVGKQDQYISAIGGITAFRFHADESVEVCPLGLSIETRAEMEQNLLLFYTGHRRSASEVLLEERSRPSTASTSVRENLDSVRRIGEESAKALEKGDLLYFGSLLTEQWRLKYQRQPSDLHKQVDDWITSGCKAGALGGKLVGAGGGGFLLFYSDRKADLRSAMKQIGLSEVSFGIDYEGATNLVVR